MLLADYGRHRPAAGEAVRGLQAARSRHPRLDRPSQGMGRGLQDRRPDDVQLRLLRRADRSVLLGTVAYRSGKAFDWDAEKLQPGAEAEQFLSKEYRKGWEVA